MENQLTAARGLISVLGGLLIVGVLVWLGFWVQGQVLDTDASAAANAPPPPAPPTELQRNTCWLDQSQQGCAEILKQTGPPADPACPLGGADQGNWSDGRRCAFEGQECPPAATCGSMFSRGMNQKYYLGKFQPDPAPPPERPATIVNFTDGFGIGVGDGSYVLTSLNHTDDGTPYDVPALYPKDAMSSTGTPCVKDPTQPGCPPTDEKALCCSLAPPGQCVEDCPTDARHPCEGDKIPYAVFHHESCGGSELVHTVNPGSWDMDYGI